ncbi:MAG: hypothetical protein ABIR38_09970 [Chthoniobacterales bacterium]
MSRAFAGERAFSLVEVVVAIGIVSFAVLSTFGLLSVATDTNKRSRDEQSIAQLVQNEFQRIRSLSSANFPATTYVTRYYDAALNDLGTAISGAAIYQLQIAIVTPPAPATTDRTFNAEVHYPANAAAANQKIVRFTGLMNLPP